MRRLVSAVAVRLYQRVLRTGVLDRPRARDAFEFAYLTYKRLLEAGPVHGLRPLVAPGSTVIDVGANIGFFTTRFAAWVGPAGRVIALEPEAHNVTSLRRRLVRSGVGGVVQCVQAAAADCPGQLHLAVTLGHPGDHHLAREGELVDAVTVDQLVDGDPRTVTLIKIDVQGAESMVLAGAEEVLRRDRPAIYLEIDGQALVRFGSSPKDLLDTVTALGYVPRRITRKGPAEQQDPDELLARSAAGYIDVLLVPR